MTTTIQYIGDAPIGLAAGYTLADLPYPTTNAVADANGENPTVASGVVTALKNPRTGASYPANGSGQFAVETVNSVPILFGGSRTGGGYPISVYYQGRSANTIVGVAKFDPSSTTATAIVGGSTTGSKDIHSLQALGTQIRLVARHTSDTETAQTLAVDVPTTWFAFIATTDYVGGKGTVEIVGKRPASADFFGSLAGNPSGTASSANAAAAIGRSLAYSTNSKSYVNSFSGPYQHRLAHVQVYGAALTDKQLKLERMFLAALRDQLNAAS